MDARVAATYAKDSKATNKNKLSDPYVKAIRWASDRIGEEGVVAFVRTTDFLMVWHLMGCGNTSQTILMRFTFWI